MLFCTSSLCFDKRKKRLKNVGEIDSSLESSKLISCGLKWTFTSLVSFYVSNSRAKLFANEIRVRQDDYLTNKKDTELSVG